MDLITANSIPIYGSSGWSCADWAAWYNVLPPGTADVTWCNAWTAGISKLGGGKGSAPGAGWFFDSVPVDCRTFDANFRAFLQAHPVCKSAVFSGVFGSTVGLGLSTAKGTIDAGLNVVNNLSSTADKVSKAVEIVLPILVFAGGLTLIVVGAKYVKGKPQPVKAAA